MATLALEQVSKIYDNGVEAVRRLDLEVADGEFVVLVGPSGCGKATALRMVAGLEEITAGTVRLGGKVVNDISAKDRDIAMVFQNYALYPHLSVHDNIAFSLSMRGVGKAERDRKVREAAEVLGLTEVLARRPRELSGGQRQRVAMGRALVREPAVFLMDEPLSNLDAKLRVQMRTEVLRVQRRLGVATLYVTHDQTEAMTMGDRVAVLRAGSLQQLARPQELYDHPANLFVASFMGSPAMNLYEASVSGPAERVASSSARGAGALARARAPSAGADRLEWATAHRRGSAPSISWSIRARSRPTGGGSSQPSSWSRHSGTSSSSTSRSTRRRVADQAEATGVDGTPAGGIAGTPLANSIARVDPAARIATGELATFFVDVERLHFFDPGTGASLVRV